MIAFRPNFRVFAAGDSLAGAALRHAFRAGGWSVEEGPAASPDGDVLLVRRGHHAARIRAAPPGAPPPPPRAGEALLLYSGASELALASDVVPAVDALAGAIWAAAQLLIARRLEGIVVDLDTERVLDVPTLRRLVSDAELEPEWLIGTSTLEARDGLHVRTRGVARVAGAEVELVEVARSELPRAAATVLEAATRLVAGRSAERPFAVGELEARLVRPDAGCFRLVAADGASLAPLLAVPQLASIVGTSPPPLESEPVPPPGAEGALTLRALRELEEAISRPPGAADDAWSPATRGQRLRGAYAAVSRVLERVPGHPAALAVRANVAAELGLGEVAQESAVRALLTSPPPRIGLLAGRALLRAGFPREAAAAFQSVEAEVGPTPGLRVLRALAGIAAGRAASAAPLLREAAALCRDRGDAATAIALELDATDVGAGRPPLAAELAFFFERALPA